MTKNMTENEIRQDRINKLIELAQQNPELQIVPMVDSDLGGDEFAYYMGSWGDAEIDEVCHEDERIYFRSWDEEEIEDKIIDRLALDNPAWSDTYLEEQAKEKVSEMKWVKVIVVKIRVPY